MGSMNIDVGVDPNRRFQLELEFVQCLANPQYLNWLSQSRYFDDPSFLEFLNYLQYWRQPQYARFIIYPHCLDFLELLQRPEFRSAIANPNYKELVNRQQFNSWLHGQSGAREAAKKGGTEQGPG